MKKVKTSKLTVTLFFSFVLLYGCGPVTNSNNSDPCLGRSSTKYHISYFEICGNAEKPITNGREKTVTLWAEIDSPFSSTGKVWIGDIYLERSDKQGENLLPNPLFDNAFSSWLHHENAMCLSTDTWCRNIVEFTQDGVWSIDNNVFHSGSAAARVDMLTLGQGYQTHIFLYPLITIEGIPAGVEFKAHAYVKVEGDVQVRLGIDFRENDVNPSNPRENIRAVNGRIIQGTTDWTILYLR